MTSFWRRFIDAATSLLACLLSGVDDLACRHSTGTGSPNTRNSSGNNSSNSSSSNEAYLYTA
jgi:hypothetical protein